MAKGPRRDSKRENFWRRLIGGQAGSGLSIRAWCRKHAVQEASFYWWRRRLAEDEAVRLAPAFVPVRLAENSATHAEPEIEIFLAREPRVRVRGLVNRQILSDVLAVMAEHLGPDGGRASTSVGEVEPC
jgi:hypothetical protein